MGQKHVVDQGVQRPEVGAIDAEEVIGLSGQRPGRDDLGPGGQPDIRSFIQYEMDAHAHQSLVNFCRVYIDDPIFSK